MIKLDWGGAEPKWERIEPKPFPPSGEVIVGIVNARDTIYVATDKSVYCLIDGLMARVAMYP